MTHHASDPGKLHETLDDWPKAPRDLADELIDRYGPPDEVLRSRLVWHANGSWKRTEVHRSGASHAFPTEHEDHLEQTIDYRVPPEKASDLLRFNGSLRIERTKGELSSRCNSEAMNVLAINLAHDIVLGHRTPEQAREKQALTALELEMGGQSDLAKSFDFSPVPDQGDPDERIVTEAMMQKVKDLFTSED